MRKTLLVFTTMALALLLAAGMAWAAPGPPTVVSTVPPTPVAPALPPTNVDPTANIKAKFSEAMKEGSINTSTFYLLLGHFTAANPPLSCTTTTPPVPPSTTPVTTTAPCPAPLAATVSYNDDTKTAKLNPTSTLLSGTEYTAVVEGTGDGDMKAVKDRDGTALATDYIFYFTTASGGGGIGRG
jgi:D-alanyl-D-alanine carboxypeptidase